MPLVKVLQDYGSAEQYAVGQVVDMTDPAKLIAEGKVELFKEEAPQKTEPVKEDITIKPKK